MASEGAYSEESAQVWREISHAANAIAVECLNRGRLFTALEMEISTLARSKDYSRPLSDAERVHTHNRIERLKNARVDFAKSHTKLAQLHRDLTSLLSNTGGSIPLFNTASDVAMLQRTDAAMDEGRALLKEEYTEKDDAAYHESQANLRVAKVLCKRRRA